MPRYNQLGYATVFEKNPILFCENKVQNCWQIKHKSAHCQLSEAYSIPDNLWIDDAFSTNRYVRRKTSDLL